MKMIKRKLIFGVLLVFISNLFFSCNNDSKKTVKVGYLPIIAHLPAAVALNEKKFEGINLEFIVYPNSNDLLSDLQSGKIDIATTLAMAPIVQLANTLKKDSKDLNMEIFSYSETTVKDPFDGVFVKENSTIKDLVDLKGKRVGVFPGSTAKNIISYFLLEKFKIAKTEIEYVSLPPAAQANALRSGDIDALFTYETIRTLMENQGFKQISGSIIAQVLENAPYGCSAINKDFRKKHPNLAEKFISGFDQGIFSVRNTPENARKVLVSALGVSTDIANTCHLEKRLTSTELANNLAVFDEFIKLIIKIESLNTTIQNIDAKSLIIH